MGRGSGCEGQRVPDGAWTGGGDCSALTDHLPVVFLQPRSQGGVISRDGAEQAALRACGRTPARGRPHTFCRQGRRQGSGSHGPTLVLPSSSQRGSSWGLGADPGWNGRPDNNERDVREATRPRPRKETKFPHG